MLMLLAGLMGCVGAVVAFYIRRTYARKVDAMQATPTVSASDLRPASLPETPVEVKGIIRCDAPLSSEIGNSSCVYYEMKVVRMTTERDGDRTRTHEHTLAENSRSVPFYVEDATGRVLVQPVGAKFEAFRTIDRTQRHLNDMESLLQLAGNVLGNHDRTRYQLSESIIAPDSEVYVLGQAYQENDEVFIGAPAGAVAPFIVSYKSEELLLRHTQRGVFWLALASIASAGIGITLLIKSALPYLH